MLFHTLSPSSEIVLKATLIKAAIYIIMLLLYLKVTNIQEHLFIPYRKTVACPTAPHRPTILIKQLKPFRMPAALVHDQPGATFYSSVGSG